MHNLYRHTAVTLITTFLAFCIGMWWASTNPIFQGELKKSIVLEFSLYAALASGCVWLVISFILSKSRPLPWLIIGAVSPLIIVPTMYQIPHLFTTSSSHDYGFAPPWRTGVALVQNHWIIFLFVGVIFGAFAYGSTLLIKTIKMQNKAQ